jgi:hypothetical protein
MRTILLPLVLLLPASSSSCSHAEHEHAVQGSEAAAGGSPLEPSESAAALRSAKHSAVPLKCGCAIEEVGYCGEYAQIDGRFVELGLPPVAALGDMPFCGKEGLKGDLEGRLEGGRFMASAFSYSE